ncbi:unnamed protein product [Porites lobata]|uniref:G-protein coupled receptors family 1 profile domain-containing protein n=1 Tax=Porites lobata TaxID=104759 RepID=A0ABN8NGK9_9CNID|nr:unnamed protein product [Porites lobata]
MTAISVDRYLALRYHMRYPNMMTSKRATCVAATFWCKNVIFSLLYIWKKNAIFLVTYKEHWNIRWYFADTILFMNSAINPFLYFWRNREVWEAVLKIARKSLAVSDLFVGILLLPVNIAIARFYILSGSSSYSRLFRARFFFTFQLCGVSLETMTAISVDRYLALRYHMRYPNLMTSKRAVYVAATFWCKNVILSLISIWKRNTIFLVGFSWSMLKVTYLNYMCLNPSLRTPSTILLCSLAVSDLFVGFLVLPVNIAIALTPLSRSSSYLRLSQARTFLIIQLCGVSLDTMTAISVDRYLALRYHMRYPNLMTFKRAMYVAATFWCKNFILSLLIIWKRSAIFLLELSLLPYVFSFLQLLTVQFIESFDTINIRCTPNSKPYRV